MKAHSRLRRALRSLALTGCLSALLATPTVAGAMPIKGDASAAPAPPTLQHKHGRPASQAPYALPSGFQSDAQSARSASRPYTPPSGFKTDAQTKAPGVSTVPASQTVVVRHIAGDSDHTLAIVLASAALGIALCGTGFAALRVTRIQRRVVGSNS